MEDSSCQFSVIGFPGAQSFVFIDIPGSFVKTQLSAVSLQLSANLFPTLDETGSGVFGFFAGPLFS
jgi:hypothetical protein